MKQWIISRLLLEEERKRRETLNHAKAGVPIVFKLETGFAKINLPNTFCNGMHSENDQSSAGAGAEGAVMLDS